MLTSKSLGLWTLSIVWNSKYCKTQRFGNLMYAVGLTINQRIHQQGFDPRLQKDILFHILVVYSASYMMGIGGVYPN
jgi:hypothetical protein